MSTFSPEQFLQSRHTGSLDTKYAKCPPGEYRGQIDGLEIRRNEIKKGDRAGEIITMLDVAWQVLDERVMEALNRDKVLVRQSIFLDMTAELQLDYGTGKNVQLGRLREALGQNDPKREWFPNLLIGAMAKIRVEQKPNDKDPEDPYVNVTEVASLR